MGEDREGKWARERGKEVCGCVRGRGKEERERARESERGREGGKEGGREESQQVSITAIFVSILQGTVRPSSLLGMPRASKRL